MYVIPIFFYLLSVAENFHEDVGEVMVMNWKLILLVLVENDVVDVLAMVAVNAADVRAYLSAQTSG